MIAYDVLIVFEMLFHSLGWNLGKVMCMVILKSNASNWLLAA